MILDTALIIEARKVWEDAGYIVVLDGSKDFRRFDIFLEGKKVDEVVANLQDDEDQIDLRDRFEMMVDEVTSGMLEEV